MILTPHYIEPATPARLEVPWLQVTVGEKVYSPHLVRLRKRWFQAEEIRNLDLKRHSHSHCIYHLIYYFDGASIQVDHKIAEVGPGQMVLIDPDVHHNVIPREPRDSSILTLMFTYQSGNTLLSIPFEGLLERLAGHPVQTKTVIDDSQGMLCAYFTILEKEVLGRDTPDLQRVSYCLAGLLNEITGTALRRGHLRLVPEDILEAQRYILTNLNKPVTIETLTEISNLSRSQLIGKFKQYCGMSPIDFLIHERIEKSKTYLLHSSRRIKEIAWLCGFQSEYYFCKTFKKRTHLTPGQFRSGRNSYSE